MEVIGRAENTARLLVDVKQGSIYYIQQTTYMGTWAVNNELIMLSEAEGKRKVSEGKPPKVKE